MKNLCDSHVHSHYSIDSSSSIEALCQGAPTNGMTHIAVSDHYDLNPLDEGCQYYQPEPFAQEFATVREQHADTLHLLKGVEFGEPHCFPDIMDALQTQGYDVIIGSIHWVGDLFAGSNPSLHATHILRSVLSRDVSVDSSRRL